MSLNGFRSLQISFMGLGSTMDPTVLGACTLLLLCICRLCLTELTDHPPLLEETLSEGADATQENRGKTVSSGNPVDMSVSQCVTVGETELLALESDGDIIVGGLFPLHYEASYQEYSYQSKPTITSSCKGFDHRAFRWMMTMVFAVEEINNSSALLPGIRLGYRIMDSCDNIQNSLQALFPLISSSKRLTSTPEKINSVNTSDQVGSKNEELGTAQSDMSACLLNSPVPAVVGLASSSPTRAAAQTLGVFNIPLVSYFATCTCLTDKRVYPSFFRTVPSDVFQVRGLVDLVMHLKWSWLGTIGTTDDYSQYGIQAFSEQFQQQGGCVEFHLTFAKSPTLAEIQLMADKLQSSTARVVVVFATEGQLLDLFFELAQRNVTGLQWVASEAWVTASLLTATQLHPLLEGTVGFSFPGVTIPGLKKFLLDIKPSPKPGMEFVNMFWEEQFGCELEFGSIKTRENGEIFSNELSGLFGFGSEAKIPNISSVNQKSTIESRDFAERSVCTGFENLSLTGNSYTDVSQVRISYNVYKVIYAIAHALHSLLDCDLMKQDKEKCVKQQHFSTEEFLHHLRFVNFTNKFGERIHFDPDGEPVPLYHIINWQKDSSNKIRFIKVGSYDGSAPLGQQLKINQNNIVWTKGKAQVPVSLCSEPCPPGSRQGRRQGKPHCCFDCFPCADGEISNETGSTGCTKCPDGQWSDHAKVKCVPGVEDFLSFHDSMGIILVVLTLLGFVLTTTVTGIFHRFRKTPIVKANNAEISFLLLLSLKLCFLCSLVFIGQPSVWTCRLRQAAFGVSFVICLSCLLVKTIVVLLAFQSNLPGRRALKLFGPSQQRVMIVCTTAPQVCLCAGWVMGAPPFPFKSLVYQATTGKIILECKEPWPPGFYLELGYIGLLALVCLLLAFLGRKLPDSFNEAKLITFSMLIFWAVWISFIPAYISSPGKFSVAVEIFAILASSFGLLLCIFGPKCYIILLHPEKNVKKCVTGKFS